ncbi:oligoribonuclease [Paenibacillus sp. NPDC057967]|uniref:oligoribonuclease n=1 Tax=Paenibacillus sp. NPDC057967 TaxID=3346293 RepID=UPI0036DD2AC5
MTEQKAVKQKASTFEPQYTKAEIIAAASRFEVSSDVMAGALRRINKDTLTRSEVEKAIQDFKRKKV